MTKILVRSSYGFWRLLPTEPWRKRAPDEPFDYTAHYCVLMESRYIRG